MNSQLIQQGRAAYRAGDFSAAAQMLGAAKTPDEIMGEADHLRGNALMHLGMYAEAAEAYADPQAFLAANPDINYDDTYPIPLGEWVVVGSLPDTVLFQGDSYAELLEQIIASFNSDVPFNIKPKQLAKTEDLTALNRIQIQMSALSPQDGGYVLLNFSQPLDDEIQAVLVYGNDLPRVLELCAEVGIHGEPSLEALRVAVHV